MKELSPYLLRRQAPPLESSPASFDGGFLEEPEGAHLRDYLRVLRKHLWLLVSCFCSVILLTLLVVLMMTPIYTAETTLLIERKNPQVLDVKEVLAEPLVPFDEYDYYKTQYEVLKSRSLAAQVIRDLELDKNRLFTGEGLEKGLVTQVWMDLKKLMELWFSPPRPVEGNLLGVKSEHIDSYLDDMLTIEPLRRTRMVKIAFSTRDSELSAQIANAHAEAYIRQGLKLRTQASEEALNFLEEKLVDLKERVEKSEVALNRYRRDKGILSLDEKENIVVERLNDLNKRLTEAEAERITLEAQVRLIRKRAYDALPAVINNTLIQTLKEQLAKLEGERAQLAAQFKSEYPRLAQLEAQVAESRARLQQEVRGVVSGIETSYLAAEAKEKELGAKMEEQKAATLGLKDASVEYAILAREANTNRQLYDNILQRMKEMQVTAELRSSNISVIDKAEPPSRPSKPRKKLSLLLSAFIGLFGGIGLAFFFEYLDNTLKTPEEAERYLGLPSLGLVPDFLSVDHSKYGNIPKSLSHTSKKEQPRGDRKKLLVNGHAPQNKELVLAHHPLSVVTEAYRTLRTSILLSRAGEPPKVTLFTSSTHGEGKTSTAINTAVIFAQMGVRVLVIDADLRRPRCHKVLGVENDIGLSEVLTGQREPLEAIRPTRLPHLFFLSSGALPPNPAELVGSRKMKDLLVLLQDQYDYILIDSPPIMPVSDAVLLAAMADGVVLVVRGQRTPKQLVKETRARLRHARAKILGVVLNGVNVQSGDYAYYYSHYYSYYHHSEPESGGLRS